MFSFSFDSLSLSLSLVQFFYVLYFVTQTHLTPWHLQMTVRWACFRHALSPGARSLPKPVRVHPIIPIGASVTMVVLCVVVQSSFALLFPGRVWDVHSPVVTLAPIRYAVTQIQIQFDVSFYPVCTLKINPSSTSTEVLMFISWLDGMDRHLFGLMTIDSIEPGYEHQQKWLCWWSWSHTPPPAWA